MDDPDSDNIGHMAQINTARVNQRGHQEWTIQTQTTLGTWHK